MTALKVRSMESIGSPLMWSLFAAFVVVALLVDFFAMRRQGAHRVSIKEAAVWSVIWVGVSLVFLGWLWWHLDAGASREVANAKALEFLTGYLVEKALVLGLDAQQEGLGAPGGLRGVGRPGHPQGAPGLPRGLPPVAGPDLLRRETRGFHQAPGDGLPHGSETQHRQSDRHVRLQEGIVRRGAVTNINS
jgi:hypothetical protein